MDLDFISRTHRVQDGAMYTNKNLADIATVTRASTRWRYNEAGLLVQDAANVASYDYEPAALAARGQLIEEQRVNLFAGNNTLPATGQAGAGAAMTATANAAPGITGANTMTRFVRTDTGTVRYIVAFGNTFASAGSSACMSVFVRRGTVGRYAALRMQCGYPARVDATFDLDAGTRTMLLTAGDATNGAAGIINCGGGLYRIWIAGTAGAAVWNAALFSPVDATNGAPDNANTTLCDGYFEGVQVEAGLFPSSYMPTSGSQVTRAADSAVITDLSKIGFNASEGTIYVEWEDPLLAQAGANRAVFSLSDGTASNRISLFKTAAGDRQVRCLVGGSGVSSGVANTQFTAGKHKDAIAFKGGDFQYVYNGVLGPYGAPGMPVVNSLAIGREETGGSQLCGWIRNVRYVPRRLSNAELQALTA